MLNKYGDCSDRVSLIAAVDVIMKIMTIMMMVVKVVVVMM